MTTQIADQTTGRVLDLIVQAEAAVFQALYEGSSVVRQDRYRDINPAPDAPREVLKALREASEALRQVRALAHQHNTAN